MEFENADSDSISISDSKHGKDMLFTNAHMHTYIHVYAHTHRRGLTINIQPHIYKADPLVLTEWEEAQRGFSRTLCDILIKYYVKVVTHEQALQSQMQVTMQQTIQQARLSEQD